VALYGLFCFDQEFDERDIEEFSTAYPSWLKQKTNGWTKVCPVIWLYLALEAQILDKVLSTH